MIIKNPCVSLAFVMVGLLPVMGLASPVSPLPGNRTVMLLPARQRTVQMGFDLLQIRPQLLLISYQGTAESADAGMHVWDGREWLRLSDSDYQDGRFLRTGTAVDQMYLIGREAEVPGILQYRPVWSEEMHWIQSLQVSDLVNILGQRFRFTRDEWRWLARLHDLDLSETRIRRRRIERKEVLPEREPEETRRPLLERLRLHRERAPVEPARPRHREREDIDVEPRRELPDRPEPRETLPPMPEAPDDPVLEDPDPLPLPGDPEPAEESPPLVLEKGAAVPPAHAPVPEAGEREAETFDRPAEPDPPRERNDPDRGLTPEEIEFFELIRREFPDLDDPPNLP